MAAITQTQLARYIAERLDSGSSSTVIAGKVAGFLVASRRSRELSAVMRKVTKLRAAHGTIEATVTSARPLSDKQKKDVRRLFETDTVIINELIDPGVLGGLRIETAESEIDMTVMAQLRQLKRLTKKGAK